MFSCDYYSGIEVFSCDDRCSGLEVFSCSLFDKIEVLSFGGICPIDVLL